MTHDRFVRRTDLGQRDWACTTCHHRVPERATPALTDAAKRAHTNNIHKQHETEDQA